MVISGRRVAQMPTWYQMIQYWITRPCFFYTPYKLMTFCWLWLHDLFYFSYNTLCLLITYYTLISDRKSTQLHHNMLRHTSVNHTASHLGRLERDHRVGQHCERLALPVQHLAQGLPELGGHEAVEDEVGRAVDQREHVHDVSQRVVALLVELHPMDGREEAQGSLKIELQLSRGHQISTMGVSAMRKRPRRAMRSLVVLSVLLALLVEHRLWATPVAAVQLGLRVEQRAADRASAWEHHECGKVAVAVV